jgi:hypothetical protein
MIILWMPLGRRELWPRGLLRDAHSSCNLIFLAADRSPKCHEMTLGRSNAPSKLYECVGHGRLQLMDRIRYASGTVNVNVLLGSADHAG